MVNPAKDCLRRVWSWTRVRLLALWRILRWLYEGLCCCGWCELDEADAAGGNQPDFEKGLSSHHAPPPPIRSSDLLAAAAGTTRNIHPIASTTITTTTTTTMGDRGGAATSGAAGGQVHKIIMVGSGGVGKSALTLQFMYDEVR